MIEIILDRIHHFLATLMRSLDQLNIFKVSYDSQTFVTVIALVLKLFQENTRVVEFFPSLIELLELQHLSIVCDE